MDGVVAAVVLLGVFHGVNPAQGWLFAVFQGVHRKKTWHIPTTIAVVSTGHIAAVAPLLAITFLAAQYTTWTPMLVSGVLLGFGAYRLVKGYRHPISRLNVAYPQLAVWGFLSGLSHGSGLTLLPLLTSETAMALGLLHWAATGVTMLGMAFLFTYVLTLNALRRIWVNYDLIWSVFLIVVGGAMLVSMILPIEPPETPSVLQRAYDSNGLGI